MALKANSLADLSKFDDDIGMGKKQEIERRGKEDMEGDGEMGEERASSVMGYD